ncbi:MAG: hypothetical protein MUF43_13225 [Flavobacterium sp.]|nr:hypothetical protein [Flavobacterium sp.]
MMKLNKLAKMVNISRNIPGEAITAHDLSSFGKVERFEEVNNQFHVIISKGFMPSAHNINDVMEKIKRSKVYHRYKQVKYFVTEDNMFHLILG